MQQWIPEFNRAGLRIVALTTDSPEQNLRVAKRLRLTIPILSDPQGRILRKIGMFDSTWNIASYGYYLLGPNLGVISHYKGSWNTTEDSKTFFLGKVPSKKKKAS